VSAVHTALTASPTQTLQRLALQVAACCRLLHQEGILNYSGHVSARVPGRDAFLIHPFLESRANVRAEDILICGYDCRLEPDSPPGKPPRESFIHAEIYRARADVQAVAHTHSELAAAFTLARTTLLPMKSHAVRWASGIPIHPDPRRIETPEQGRELAETLGPHQAALLRAHGGVVVAESIPALLVDSVHFDENARAQVQALALGPILPLTEREFELLRGYDIRDQHVDKIWRYYVGKGLTAGVLESDEGLLG
jgi:ribulose-5-phosphate 4-epimerase/fuculose-1-phosphate aldolase